MKHPLVYSLALVIVGLAVTASQALAQPTTCNVDPYIPIAFSARCWIDPYQTSTSGHTVRTCVNEPLLTAPPIWLSISEGIVGTPDHELGYIILSNPSTEPQDAIVELMLRGNNDTTYIRNVHLEKLSSATIDLRADPLFQCTARIFTTFVYFERAGTAELKIYGLRDPAHPLAYVTTDKDALVVPRRSQDR